MSLIGSLVEHPVRTHLCFTSPPVWSAWLPLHLVAINQYTIPSWHPTGVLKSWRIFLPVVGSVSHQAIFFFQKCFECGQQLRIDTKLQVWLLNLQVYVDGPSRIRLLFSLACSLSFFYYVLPPCLFFGRFFLSSSLFKRFVLYSCIPGTMPGIKKKKKRGR